MHMDTNAEPVHGQSQWCLVLVVHTRITRSTAVYQVSTMELVMYKTARERHVRIADQLEFWLTKLCFYFVHVQIPVI